MGWRQVIEIIAIKLRLLEAIAILFLGSRKVFEVLVTPSGVCRTAYGDLDAELGFAGLVVNTGAKSAWGMSPMAVP